ncbi:MAG: hypothetical protein AAF372_04025, partial [Pseudomonadota bacterium]
IKLSKRYNSLLNMSKYLYQFYLSTFKESSSLILYIEAYQQCASTDYLRKQGYYLTYAFIADSKT